MFQLIRESTLKVVVTIYSIKVSSFSQYFITRSGSLTIQVICIMFQPESLA